MNPSISPPPAQRSLPGNIPHIPPPPPPPKTSHTHNPMGGSLSFLKTIIIPLLISLAFYLTLTYALLPLYRRHRARYAQYLPLPLHTLSTQTSSVRTRLSQTLTSVLLPSSWQRRWSGGGRGSESDDGLFDDEEGEGMVGFEVDAGRREALERDAAVRGEEGADERRLSRDLEEGFRDDSDDGQGHDQRSLTAGR